LQDLDAHRFRGARRIRAARRRRARSNAKARFLGKSTGELTALLKSTLKALGPESADSRRRDQRRQAARSRRRSPRAAGARRRAKLEARLGEEALDVTLPRARAAAAAACTL
jgi:hypothetical protein